MMHDFHYASNVSSELTTSLWRCDLCETFVSIHSVEMIEKARCPMCTGEQLTFCGSFDQILGMGAAHA